MLWFSLLSLLLLAPTVFGKEPYVPPQELEIITTDEPSVCREKAEDGDFIQVHYTGILHDSKKKFDSSRDRGTPFDLTLGRGMVIQGWEKGLQGMCEKEKRTIVIPSHMGYGPRGFGSVIPPHSALEFDVELLQITKGKKASKEEL